MGLTSDIKYYFTQVTVEPVAIAVYLGAAIYGVIQPMAMARKMVLEYADEEDLWVHPSTASTQVQKKMVMWQMLFTAINFPIAMFMSIIWSALSDKHGRQQPMLLGLTSLNWAMVGTLLVFTNAIDLPIWIKLLTTFVTGLFGENTLQYIAAQSFLADIVPNKQSLTIRMNIVSILRITGTTIGEVVVMVWTSMTFGEGMIIAHATVTGAFLYILLRIPQVPPVAWARFHRRSSQQTTVRSGRSRTLTVNMPPASISEPSKPRAVSYMSDVSELEEVEEESVNCRMVINKMLYTFRDTWYAFAKKRKGHLRFMICTIALLQFITSMYGVEISVLISQYTLMKPFEWQPKDLAYWSLVGTLVGIVGQMGGIWLFKKIMKLRDTTIIMIGMVSGTAAMVPMALASDLPNPMLWMQMSNVLGLFSGLVGPTLASLTTNMVPVDEVGKVFTAFSMTQFVGQMVQQFALQPIYILTIDWYKAFMFWCMTALSGFCILIMFIVHTYCIKEGIGDRKHKKRNREQQENPTVVISDEDEQQVKMRDLKTD